MLLCIIIPAYNEEKVITKTLESIPRKIDGVKKIIKVVVNDGSNDKTAKHAKKVRAVVLTHILNRGLGAALKTGLTYAQNIKADIAVTFDADGQHHPNDISSVITPIIKGYADIVIGSRFKKKSKAPRSRKFINFGGNAATLLMFGIWTTDSQSGFRAFSRKALKVINLKSQRMEVSSEIFKEVKRNKLKLKEVPIKAIYTKYSMSKGQPLLNGFNVFGKISLLLFR